ncbi:ABC transporter permease [Beijerinckia mobilis]|uniref:ABC transporter permease n=1 Tax=Beijerinckia mobilis TaxID=231434 RepID=UPI000557477E|nr:ABC transporter permease [Beijerinckia mobilis]
MVAALFRILALIHKEMLAVLKDKRSRITLFAPVIAQSILFGYAATYDLSNIPYVVIDRDRSEASHALLAKLDGSGLFTRIATLDSVTALKHAIDTRKALIAVQIGEDFERRLRAGNAAPVQVIADGRNSNTAVTATLYLTQIANNFATAYDRKGATSNTHTIAIDYRYWYNPNAESRWHFVPGMIATLTMLQILLISAMSVAREREQGTFDQLLVTPFRPMEIMIGKAIPSILIGIVQATLVVVIALFWFHIPLAGSLAALYGALALYLLASIGLGLLLSSLAATMQQALLYTFLVLLPFILFSGLTTPISAMPRALQYLTLVDPLRYAIDAIDAIMLKGSTLSALLVDLWPLIPIGFFTLGLAAHLFRNRLS